ncbi:hypothetical protein E1301_Tti000997 [Triplophysa tibetana]|uniref:Uncharacterized protein n=1 Tax=Triplophysa tibetana TaxID=1572043 RepID=A0A5A9N650_9TELE|nr:hypothetical protein E1301_Tti000997 [Triplophysa tibetana]
MSHLASAAMIRRVFEQGWDSPSPKPSRWIRNLCAPQHQEVDGRRVACCASGVVSVNFGVDLRGARTPPPALVSSDSRFTLDICRCQIGL